MQRLLIKIHKVIYPYIQYYLTDENIGGKSEMNTIDKEGIQKL